MEFNLDEMMDNLATVCRSYKGTAEEHEYLSEVMKILRQKLKRLEELEAQKD